MRLTFAIRVVRVLDREREEKARKMSSLWCVHLHRSADGSLDSSHRCMYREKATRESFFLLQSQRPSWPDGIIYRYFFFLVERQASANRTGFNFIDERISVRQSFFRVLLKKKDTGYDIVFFLSLSIHSCQRLQIGMLLQVI